MRHTRCVSLALAVVLVLTTTVALGPASATTGNPVAITGTLYAAETGLPLAMTSGVYIMATWDGGTESTYSTDQEGRYSLVVPANTYVQIQVGTPSQARYTAVYKDRQLGCGSDPVFTGSSGAQGIDFILNASEPWSLSGIIATDDGSTITTLTPLVYQWVPNLEVWDPVEGIVVVWHDSGSYSFGVGAGRFRIQYATESDPYMPCFNGGATTLAEAQDIVVGSSDVRDLDVTLTRARYVHGTVMSSQASLPVANASITVLAEEGGIPTSPIATATADAGGCWTVKLPDSQPAYVRVEDPSGAHSSRFFPDAPSAATATTLVPTIEYPGPTANVVLPVQATATVVGTVKSGYDGAPIANARVALLMDTGSTSIEASHTTCNADGTFTFPGQIPGSYRLFITDPSGEYVDSWFPAPMGVIDPLELTLAGSPLVVNATAAPRACIRGRVTASDGTPLPGIEVRITDVDASAGGDSSAVQTTSTASDGTYRFRQLNSGAWYSVAFVDTSGTYRDQTFPFRGLPAEDAFVVPVADGAPLVDVDATLQTPDETIASRTLRVFGADRFQTAIAASRDYWSSADTVVIASGTGFADALAAAPLAGCYDAPLLLTGKAALPTGLMAELERLGTTSVIIVGGTAAVGTSIESSLRSAGMTVERIAGKDRYQTAADVGLRVSGLNGDWFKPPLICRGDSFADALAAGPIAYATQSPIFLTQPTTLPPATGFAWRSLSGAGNDSVYVVGSQGAVSDSVIQQLADYGNTETLYFYRFEGADRYATAAALARESGLFDHTDAVGLARGDDFPDALAGGVTCGHVFAPILLTPPTTLNSSTASFLRDTGRYNIWLAGFGGSRSLSDGTLSAANTALGTSLYDIDQGTIASTGIRPTAPAYTAMIEMFKHAATYPDIGRRIQDLPMTPVRAD